MNNSDICLCPGKLRKFLYKEFSDKIYNNDLKVKSDMIVFNAAVIDELIQTSYRNLEKNLANNTFEQLLDEYFIDTDEVTLFIHNFSDSKWALTLINSIMNFIETKLSKKYYILDKKSSPKKGYCWTNENIEKLHFIQTKTKNNFNPNTSKIVFPIDPRLNTLIEYFSDKNYINKTIIPQVLECFYLKLLKIPPND